jgi:hypothetical protein
LLQLLLHAHVRQQHQPPAVSAAHQRQLNGAAICGLHCKAHCGVACRRGRSYCWRCCWGWQLRQAAILLMLLLRCCLLGQLQRICYLHLVLLMLLACLTRLAVWLLHLMLVLMLLYNASTKALLLLLLLWRWWR